jgi:hypothetical protein
VAAEVIAWAADHYRREWYVGGSTAIVITLNKLFPGLGDWYLGQQGYESQQYDGLVGPDRPDNVFAPLDDTKDYGPHGDFAARATDHSYQVWLSRNRSWLLAGLGAAGLLYLALRPRPNGAASALPEHPREVAAW